MLRTRLFLNLVPFVVILMAIGVYAIALLARLAGNVDVTVTENYGSIITAQALQLSLGGLEREVWVSTTATNGANDDFSRLRKRFENDLASLPKTTSLPGERELNEQLAANYHAFQAALSALKSASGPEARRKVHQQQILPLVLSMNAALEKIRALNSKAVLTTSDHIRKINRDVTRLMVIGIAVALVISAYACYQLSRSILQPIRLLTRATAELGAGNWDRPVPVLSSDELGELALAFNKMAAQLQEYRHSTTEEIVRLHRTMETTLASFPDPIFVLNKEGRVELANPAATDLAASLQLDGVLPERLDGVARKVLESGDNFLPHSFNEAVFYRVNGAGKFFLPRILAMRDKQEVLFGVAVVLYDVTRFRLLDAAKTNLVGTVSHELKTPLTSVRMALHLLLEKTTGSLSPKQSELLAVARDDTERLLRILNDLLDLTKLEEGHADLHKEKVAPAELLQTVLEEMGDQVSAKGLKMNCAAEPDLPTVAVDRQRIRHVFVNLLTNAIKHSPAGGEILLRATLTADRSVQFAVSDQGPGIPEQHQLRIFDRFFRVPGQTKTGAGLGLSIAREITVAHKGRIGVRSSLGGGSTFYVILNAVED